LVHGKDSAFELEKTFPDFRMMMVKDCYAMIGEFAQKNPTKSLQEILSDKPFQLSVQARLIGDKLMKKRIRDGQFELSKKIKQPDLALRLEEIVQKYDSQRSSALDTQVGALLLSSESSPFDKKNKPQYLDIANSSNTIW
jgi:hypothetical protein